MSTALLFTDIWSITPPNFSIGNYRSISTLKWFKKREMSLKVRYGCPVSEFFFLKLWGYGAVLSLWIAQQSLRFIPVNTPLIATPCLWRHWYSTALWISKVGSSSPRRANNFLPFFFCHKGSGKKNLRPVSHWHYPYTSNLLISTPF